MSAEWTIPSALTDFHDIEKALEGRQPAVFLDYDGTLTPIVDTPAQAVLSEEMRDTVRRLGERCPTAVVSGRAREDVRERVGLDNLFYAGTHGFEIVGPPGSGIYHLVGQEFLPIMEELHQRLREGLAEVPGLLLETKGYSLAVHYRLVEEARVADVEGVVDALMPDYPGLRKTHGKKVFEIRPRFDWNKGKAVEWLLETLGAGHVPLYLGDDTTDEDGFAAMASKGLGILVAEEPRQTAAGYRLSDPTEVGQFLQRLLRTIPEPG
jgi:alpha,alpha-trehalase